jgi:peptidoglycan/LPS O-acetylase OafA/YrhL
MAEREVFPSLTGLRFGRALWIALYHLVLLYGDAASAHQPWIAVGSARVDIFFVLSGFVLAHVYAVRTGGKFAFDTFFAARIARLYPLHLLEPVIFRWKHSLHFAGSWSIPAR